METKTPKQRTPAKIARQQRKNATRNKRRGAENQRQVPSYTSPNRENFRDADICPSADELLGTEPASIRRNLVSGAYDSAEDYLDLQFWLLREDFVRPVREGLAKIRAREDVEAEEAFNPLMKVYKEVRFEKLARDFRETLTFFVKIDPDQINFGNDKLFMYGSLLCFSLTEDNFSDVILCKVADCQPHLLRKGLIKVSLINQYEVLDIVFGASYSMVESEVYFEPYYRVLTALQMMALEKFPMCNYVIGKATVVKTIHEMRWDREKNPGLNKMQFAAYQRALANNLTLIQGPPGTGKTFLGLKVVKRMIELNEELENDGGQPQPPILVICATNHALDQFLEHIVEFCTDVIRVGGQSQSLLLDDFMMANKRKQYREVNKPIKKLMTQIEWTMTSLKNSIGQQLKRLNAADTLLDEQMELEDNILEKANEFHQQSMEYQGCKLEMDLVVLRSARVVGMTTTSAARLRPLLDNLRPSIMIVEEAAEVLEGHIVGALTKHCKHIVLIGDHQQLRPITSCYKLSKEYKLDVSLFERLCKNRVPFLTLDTQHRMRPEIAQLLVPTVYKQLVNDVSVRKRPNVRGMDKNLFFMSHFKPEQPAGWSRKNQHESEFLMALCRYLILQGYEPQKITIIAMYAAQVTELENLRAKHVALNSVVISSVDGYQGEENDIVLLSLVRSNDQAYIGFLWTINRVCVALSRARLGLYIVGNMENLTRDKRSVWCKINKALTITGSVGTHLKLRCSAHNGNLVPVNCAADFTLDAADAGDCVLGCTDKPRPPGSLETLLDDLHLSDKPGHSVTYTNGNLVKCASMQSILDSMDRQRAGKETGQQQGLPAPASKANGTTKTTSRTVGQVRPVPSKHFFAADFEPPAPLKPHAAVTPFLVGRAEEDYVEVPLKRANQPTANGAEGGAELASGKSSKVDVRTKIQKEMEEFDRQTMLKRNELLARVLAEAEERNARQAQAADSLTNIKQTLAKVDEMRRVASARRDAETQLGRQEFGSAALSAPSTNGRMQTGAIPKARAGDEGRLHSKLGGSQKPSAPMLPMHSGPTYVAPSQVQKPAPVRPTHVPASQYIAPAQIRPTNLAPTPAPRSTYYADPVAARPAIEHREDHFADRIERARDVALLQERKRRLELSQLRAQEEADRIERARDAALLQEHKRRLALSQLRAQEEADKRAAEKKKKSTCAVM